MDYSPAMTSEQSSFLKRPRSPTENNALPSAKIPRTATNPLQINYLARQHKETIPLVTVNEKLPEVARILGEYDGVIQRHESIAGNLGACPLGPILLKRFERLFEGPPRVLKSHARDVSVSWLDVVEFAQNNPKQFNLERTRNGVRVCQFYTKQCRVEISEEDYVLIASGMPQKLIPPQPILEDEEKELGVMDLLDRNLGQIIQIADQVSARGRQLIHKMKNRRTAILSRREQEAESLRRNTLRSDGSPMSLADTTTNGTHSGKAFRSIELSQSPPGGFAAVNLPRSGAGERHSRPAASGDVSRNHPEDLYSSSNVTIINGKSIKDASPSVRAEMMKKFLTPAEREAGLAEDTIRRSSMGTARTNAMQAASLEKPRSRSIDLTSGSANGQNPPTVAIPNTPASLMPLVKTATFERDDGGPFKSEMVRRMDNMWKGDRIIPPCDRCRRLHMDCLKNLTACMGCTKKHAKCSWKEVKASELETTTQLITPDREAAQASSASDPAPPLSAGSAMDVDRTDVERTPDEVQRSASIARASLDLTGDLPESVNADNVQEAEARRESQPLQEPREPREPQEPDVANRFNVRPPPLIQQLQEATEYGPDVRRTSFATPSAPREQDREDDLERDDDDGDDEGDRLQALAARVYRTASQSAMRP